MSRRPRISYRDLAKQTAAANEPPAPAAPLSDAPANGGEMTLPPDVAAASQPAAGCPPRQHDGEQTSVVRDRNAAAIADPTREPATAGEFAAPAFLVAPEHAPHEQPRLQRGVQSGLRFRERVRAREGVEELLVFRVAGELFAVELSAVEEAMDCPPTHPLPEMPVSMRGVFMLRASAVALYAPNALLGLEAHTADTVIVFRPNAAGRRAALAIDDVDDVLILDLAMLRDAPGTDAADGILTGVARRGRDLIGVLDAEALLAACRSDNALETV